MNEENLTIPPATKNDAKWLAKIHVDAWKTAYRNIVPDSVLERFTYEKRTRSFSDAIGNQNENTYIAEVGNWYGNQ